MTTYSMHPGSLVVLEGLDATGKSTQLAALEALAWDEPKPMFTHQPSGTSETSKQIYSITEKARDLKTHPITLQLLHLASHAEHYDSSILPALKDRSVVLDRCWWSTIAYGFFDGKLDRWCAIEDFIALCQLPTQGQLPTVVFLFNQPYALDEHNTHAVQAGYTFLASTYTPVRTVASVPSGTVKATTDWIVAELVSRGLVTLNYTQEELEAMADDSPTVPSP